MLFHTPEDLSDRELNLLSKKIKHQQKLRRAGFLAGGFTMYLLDKQFFRRAACWKRVGVAAFAGYGIGGLASYYHESILPREIDSDIMVAHNKKFA